MNLYHTSNFDLDSQNKIYVALNLFALSHFKDLLDYRTENILFWIDGIFAKLVIKDGVKLPGPHALANILEKKSQLITVIGNMDEIEKAYILKTGNKIDEHFPVPNFGKHSLNSISVKNDTMILINLPSPLQEIAAFELSERTSGCEYYCFGGALRMLAYPQLQSPTWVRKFCLEWVYRLRTDPVRRILRLLKCVFRIFRDYHSIRSIKMLRLDRHG